MTRQAFNTCNLASLYSFEHLINFLLKAMLHSPGEFPSLFVLKKESPKRMYHKRYVIIGGHPVSSVSSLES